MKIYKVGGCVRDTLLGLEPKDIDYVVVGATPEEMTKLGFHKPVGQAFPVYLHPKTGDEYAMARKEHKIGAGYGGFDFDVDPTVTLEEDLSRRDLTINSMAMDMETGEIIDPFGGQEDLRRRTLRHTSEAFEEDPVRVLRAARFAARYNFIIHHETLALMKRVVPELDHVPKERIWAEFEKGLSEEHPVNMFIALAQCGAITSFTTEPGYAGCSALTPYAGALVDFMTHIGESTPMHVRVALATPAFGDKDYDDQRIPLEYSRIAKAFHKNFGDLWWFTCLSKGEQHDVLLKLRAFNDRTLFNAVLDVVDFHDILQGYGHRRVITAVLDKACSIDAAAIAASCTNKKDIQEAVRQARIAAM